MATPMIFQSPATQMGLSSTTQKIAQASTRSSGGGGGSAPRPVDASSPAPKPIPVSQKPVYNPNKPVTAQSIANSLNAGRSSVQVPFDPLRDVMSKVPKVTGNVPSPAQAQTFLEVPATYMVKNVYAHTWGTTSNPLKAEIGFFKAVSNPVKFLGESKALYEREQSNIRVAESERTAIEKDITAYNLYPTPFSYTQTSQRIERYNAFLEKTKEPTGMFVAGRIGGIATDIGLSYAGGYIFGGTGLAGGVAKGTTSLIGSTGAKAIGTPILSAGIVFPAYAEAKTFQAQGLSPYVGLGVGATRGVLSTGAFIGGAYEGGLAYNTAMQKQFIKEFERTPVKVSQLEINNKFIVARGTKVVQGQEYRFSTGARYGQTGSDYYGTGRGFVQTGAGSEAQASAYQYTFKGTNMGMAQKDIGVTAVDMAIKPTGSVSVKYIPDQPFQITKFKPEPIMTQSKFMSISQPSPLNENLINFRSVELNYVRGVGFQPTGGQPIARFELSGYKSPVYGQSYKMNLKPSDFAIKSGGTSGTGGTISATGLKLDQSLSLQRTSQALFSGLSKASATDFVPKFAVQSVKIAPVLGSMTMTATKNAKSIFSLPKVSPALKTATATKSISSGNIPSIGNVLVAGQTLRLGSRTSTISLQTPASSTITKQIQPPFVPQMSSNFFAPPMGFILPPFGFPNMGQGFPSIGGGRQIRGRRKYKYQPSLYALYFGVKAPKIPRMSFTGLSVRPIISPMRSNRRTKYTRRKRR